MGMASGDGDDDADANADGVAHAHAHALVAARPSGKAELRPLSKFELVRVATRD